MTESVLIALDAMGGDHGPSVVVPGAALTHQRRPDTRFRFYGDVREIEAQLKNHSELRAASQIVHTDTAIAMDAKPSEALRQGRRTSSMWLALNGVREEGADVAISAGNTGALMAMARFCLKSLPGIERPAIVAIWPTVKSECLVLDVGANVGARAEQLKDFALMGATMARLLFQLERPKVGLLNIGVEEVKGLDEVKTAHNWLRNRKDLPLDYVGFVEGLDIGHDVADVIVTEGFSGNIALKTAEGTAKQISAYLKSTLSHSLLSRVGAYLARDSFQALKAKMDPRRHNGGTFLGLNGIVIKSHGGTDAFGFASAIELGYDMARARLVQRIKDDLARATSDKTDMDWNAMKKTA